MIGPGEQFFVDPGCLGYGGGGETVAEGLGAGFLLRVVAVVVEVSVGVEVQCAGFACFVLGWGEDFFL